MKTISRIIKTIIIFIIFGGRRLFDNTREDIEIYVMTCHRDAFKLIVTIYSIYKYMGKSIKITVNHDNTLTKLDKIVIKLIFKNIYILSENDFNKAAKILSEYPNCAKLYTGWMGKKFLNPLIISKTAKVILLDSDLYFIKQPEEIINFINDQSAKNLYAGDPPDFFLLSKVEFKHVLGLRSEVDRLNSSLLCLQKKDMVKLDEIDKIVGRINQLKKERIMDYSYLLEQTMFIYLYAKIPKDNKKRLPFRYYPNLRTNKSNITEAYLLHFSTPSRYLWPKYLYLTKIGLFKKPLFKLIYRYLNNIKMYR